MGSLPFLAQLRSRWQARPFSPKPVTLLSHGGSLRSLSITDKGAQIGLVQAFLALSLRTGEPAVPSPASSAVVVSGEEVFLVCPVMAATGLGVPCSPAGSWAAFL